MFSPFEWVHAQVNDFWQSQESKGFLPNLESLCTLLGKNNFPVVITQIQQVTCIREIEDLFSRTDFFLTFEVRQKVVAIQVDFEILITNPCTFLQFFLERGRHGY